MNNKDLNNKQFILKIRKITLGTVYSFFGFILFWVVCVVLLGLGIAFYFICNDKTANNLVIFVLGVIFLLICVFWYIYARLIIIYINKYLPNVLNIIDGNDNQYTTYCITKFNRLYKIAKVSALCRKYSLDQNSTSSIN